MSYSLNNYDFFHNDIKLFTFKRSDYIIYSILKIEDVNKNLLIKCRISPLLGFKSLKILEQKLNSEVSFIKKDKLFYLKVILNNNNFEITILPSSKLSLKFKGDFIINNKKAGIVYGKIEGLNTKHYFEFTEENPKLIYYCLLYFAIRYYDIDDVA